MAKKTSKPIRYTISAATSVLRSAASSIDELRFRFGFDPSEPFIAMTQMLKAVAVAVKEHKEDPNPVPPWQR